MRELFIGMYTAVIIVVVSCNSSFLDVKPNMQTVVPETLEDYGMLLYDYNMFATSSITTLSMIGSDEYVISDVLYNGLSLSVTDAFQKYAYTWEKDIYSGDEASTDWSKAYARILQANVVLDGLPKIQMDNGNQASYKSIKGTALFHRAYNYYMLAQQYCAVYSEDSKHGLGLPLRKIADPTLLIGRSTLDETYRFIEKDLMEALYLVDPKRTNLSPLQASQMAVNALLVRLYMQMGDYVRAEKHAKACLVIPHQLLDYSTFSANQSYSFNANGIGNDEIIYMNSSASFRILGTTVMDVSPSFLSLYEKGDLRKDLYYTKSGTRTIFKGSYVGNSFYFTGLALDEVYLNYAECLCRNGVLDKAVDYLNTLRQKRFSSQYYVPLGALSKEQCMDLIFTERKRSLFFRGTRWQDLRRLSKENEYKETLKRSISGKEFLLEPGSKRYVWPIPPKAISVGGYQQNDR
ncbi:SusD family protein [Sphingobacterium nematocida]|uniref:SusD family protein n=1 Tax=Sphingobacterium nematocida TaxID=1513896 RepID=A0A1T5FFZ0_9SPHI|nr:RagB/SusD family nutrient uptake outer membrane protein [Sphingobacterium nematocida]SKB95079.1 SusD family protein [Sphingobacterium nematocida]